MLWTLRRILLLITVIATLATLSTLYWVTETYQHFAIDTMNGTTSETIVFTAEQRIGSQYMKKIAPFINKWSRLKLLVDGMMEMNQGKVEITVNQMLHTIEVLNDQVRLRNVVVYTKEMEMFSKAKKGTNESLMNVPSILKILQKRNLNKQRHVSAFLWNTADGLPVHSVIAPIGGFRVMGFIEFVTDPIPELIGLGGAFNGVFKLNDINGNTIFEDRDPNPIQAVRIPETLNVNILGSSGDVWATVALTRDVSAFKNANDGLRKQAIIIIAIVILGSVFVGWLLLRLAVFGRLHDFAAAMRTLALGQTDVKIPQTGSDEFGVMKKAMEELRLAVRMRYKLQEEAEVANIELKRRGKLLSEMAFNDGLTGIANRRSFDKTLEQEWRRCDRSHSPLSLILIDIDYFKKFNDHYGHIAGDECLCKVARILCDILDRPADIAARYGGEEFACILPETDEKGAMDIGEKLRKAIADHQIPHELSEPEKYVTISIGVSAQHPSKDMSCEKLISLADKALYLAKDGGRNQVVFSR